MLLFRRRCVPPRVFGKEHLGEVSEKELIDGINKVRNAAETVRH